MTPTRFKDLQHKVNLLEQDVIQKEAEVGLLRNELEDTLSPSAAMTEITSIVCDMLQDNLNFVKKNGLTGKAKESRERLLKLLDITETFNKLSITNHSLKLFNKHLFSHNQILRVKLADVTTDLKNIKLAHDGL